MILQKGDRRPFSLKPLFLGFSPFRSALPTTPILIFSASPNTERRTFFTPPSALNFELCMSFAFLLRTPHSELKFFSFAERRTLNAERLFPNPPFQL
jgi:hypothetical protein